MADWNGFKINNFDNISKEGVFAERDGEKWMLSLCPADMSPDRIEKIKNCFQDSILNKGNISQPDFYQSGDKIICAELYMSSVLDGYGSRCFPLFPSAHRQRILLGSVNVLRTLHNAHLTHGCLGPASFRIRMAADGSFRVYLAGYNYLAPADHGSYISGYPAGFTAPECIRRNVCQKADIYALGVIFYYWICGQIPIRNSDGQILFPNNIPSAYGRLISAMMNADAAMRPGTDLIISFLLGKTEAVFERAEYCLYHAPDIPAEEKSERMAFFAQEWTSYSSDFTGNTRGSAYW